MARDRWRELCKAVADDDGLPVWKDVNHWTQDKLCFWQRYIEITTNALVGHSRWRAGLAYVDLFAGAGVCQLRETKQRIPGSVLIAASARKPFATIVACEQKRAFADACKCRLDRTLVGSCCHVLTGDCNDLIQEVVALIPPGALTIALIDPKGLDVRFETVSTLSTGARADLVVLLADEYDIIRNTEYYYRQDRNSKLDKFLGSGARWRERLDDLSNPTSETKRKLFAEIYIDQLRSHLGYTHFRRTAMPQGSRPMYSLIYASKNALGLKFWDEACKRDSSGQRPLFD